jgi:hypothetical protein
VTKDDRTDIERLSPERWDKFCWVCGEILVLDRQTGEPYCPLKADVHPDILDRPTRPLESF